MVHFKYVDLLGQGVANEIYFLGPSSEDQESQIYEGLQYG